MSFEVLCPHCGASYEDWFGFSVEHDPQTTDMRCESCGRLFRPPDALIEAWQSWFVPAREATPG